MDVLDKIIAENGSLNGLFYILQENALSLSDIDKLADARTLVYPDTTTTVTDAPDVAEATTVLVTVQAYQSVLDVCVQHYGSLDMLSSFLADNSLAIDDYLPVGKELSIRAAESKNKVSNTLFALGATITNFDRTIPQDQDIYLGTEDGYYVGATTRIKIKLN